MIDLVELIGFSAGTVITVSALPQIVRNMRHSTEAAKQSLLRNLLLVTGNLGWVLYGVLKPAVAIAIMCGLGAAMNGITLLQTWRAQRRPKRPSASAVAAPLGAVAGAATGVAAPSLDLRHPVASCPTPATIHTTGQNKEQVNDEA